MGVVLPGQGDGLLRDGDGTEKAVDAVIRKAPPSRRFGLPRGLADGGLRSGDCGPRGVAGLACVDHCGVPLLRPLPKTRSNLRSLSLSLSPLAHA
jgi:hypothetical protein